MKQIIVACALLFSAYAARADELIAVKSTRTVMETLDRVEAAATADGYLIDNTGFTVSAAALALAVH